MAPGLVPTRLSSERADHSSSSSKHLQPHAHACYTHHHHHHHRHALSRRRPGAMARTNLPPLTRGILAALVLLTLLNFALRPNADWVEKVEKPLIGVGNGVPWLAIVPSTSVPWYPWVFALATVVEQNLLGLLTTGLTLFYGGRYLERAWGSHEFTKFMLFVAVIPNILTYLLYLVAFALTRKGSLMCVSLLPLDTSVLT